MFTGFTISGIRRKKMVHGAEARFAECKLQEGGGAKGGGMVHSFPDDRGLKVCRERETKERETCDRGNTRADGRRFPSPPPSPLLPSLLTLSSGSTRIPSDHSFPLRA